MKHFLYLFLAAIVVTSCDDNLQEIKEPPRKQVSESLAEIAQQNIQNLEKQQQYLDQQHGFLSLSENEKNKALNATTNALLIGLNLAKYYNNIGNEHYKDNNFEYALFYYLTSLDLKLGIGNNEGMALSFRNIALTYQALGDYENAAINYWQSYYLYQMLEDDSEMAKLLNDLGIIYDLAHDFVILEQFNVENSLALDYYMQSIDINTTLNNLNGIAQTEFNIGLCYGTYLNKTSSYALRTEGDVSRDQEDVEDEL